MHQVEVQHPSPRHAFPQGITGFQWTSSSENLQIPGLCISHIHMHSHKSWLKYKKSAWCYNKTCKLFWLLLILHLKNIMLFLKSIFCIPSPSQGVKTENRKTLEKIKENIRGIIVINSYRVIAFSLFMRSFLNYMELYMLADWDGAGQITNLH